MTPKVLKPTSNSIVTWDPCPQRSLFEKREWVIKKSVGFVVGLLVPAFILAGVVASPAVAQQAKFSTPAEANAILEKTVEAVKSEKKKALEMFNKGEGGFNDRDLQPFCFNAKAGALIATSVPANLGKNQCEYKNKTGKAFGKEMWAGAIEGKLIEVSYMYPRPGETERMPKVSLSQR